RTGLAGRGGRRRRASFCPDHALWNRSHACANEAGLVRKLRYGPALTRHDRAIGESGATVTGTYDAETASRATACRALYSGGHHALRALPRQGAFAFCPPARRSFDLSRSLQCTDVRGLGRAERAGDPGRQFSRAVQADGELAGHPRGSGAAVRRGLYSRRRQEQRLGFLFVLQERLEALLSQMVRRLSSLGTSALSEDG